MSLSSTASSFSRSLTIASTFGRLNKSHIRVPNTITANAKSGDNRINHEYEYNAIVFLPLLSSYQCAVGATLVVARVSVGKTDRCQLPLHHVNFGHIDRAKLAVDRDDHCERDRGFGSSNGDDEDGEDLPGQIGRISFSRVKECETNQGDIDGIQHNFDAHQHGDGVALDNRSVKTNTEEYSAEYQEMIEREHVLFFLPTNHNRAYDGYEQHNRCDFKWEHVAITGGTI